MKKIFTVLLAGIMVFALAACSGGNVSLEEAGDAFALEDLEAGFAAVDKIIHKLPQITPEEAAAAQNVADVDVAQVAASYLVPLPGGLWQIDFFDSGVAHVSHTQGRESFAWKGDDIQRILVSADSEGNIARILIIDFAEGKPIFLAEENAQGQTVRLLEYGREQSFYFSWDFAEYNIAVPENTEFLLRTFDDMGKVASSELIYVNEEGQRVSQSYVGETLLISSITENPDGSKIVYLYDENGEVTGTQSYDATGAVIESTGDFATEVQPDDTVADENADDENADENADDTVIGE